MIRSEQSYPCLAEKKGKALGQFFAVGNRMTAIGSSPDNEIRIEEATPQHAFILFQMGEYKLKKVSSKARISVNGEEIQSEQSIHHGDEIAMAGRIFIFLNKALLDSEKESAISGPSRLESASFDVYGSLFTAIQQLLNQKDMNQVMNALVSVVADILKCDGVNLIQEEGGLWRSLAVFPTNSQAKRFSSSAVESAGRLGKTVLLSRANLTNLPAAESVQLNNIDSVLCAPLRIKDSVRPGYLYMDRLNGHPPFNQEDRDFFDSLRSLFSDLIYNAHLIGRQKDTIKTLQGQAGDFKSGAIFEDPLMEKVFQEASRLAQTVAPLLILGETGTGKELLARYVHYNSPRRDKSFMAVNCGAIPTNLIESELFGHEKGSFTGADTKKIGLIEAAQGGTLLLDEVGELPLDMQVKLLRVLQEGEIRRVGNTEPVPVDFRLISATHRDLEENIRKGTFRSDLYYRLNVVSLKLPALRERKSDILLLANHFLKNFAAQYGMPPKTLGKNAEKSLLTWSWPGNVRELENRIHKAVILTSDPLVMTEDLGFDKSDKAAVKEGNSGWKSLKEAREAAEKASIEDCLRYFRGNVSQTSVALNVDRKVLTRLIEKLGIEAKSFKG